MARCLIIGCGCRGVSLGGELIAAGHAVRGTTRRAERSAELERLGIEAVVGDPDRVATLAPAFDHVSVACVLLGSASGPADGVAALHGTRLEMLLTRMLDTTVHGVLYEAAGSVDPGVLSEGAERVREMCEASLIPYALLDTNPSEASAWVRAARSAVDGLLGA